MKLESTYDQTFRFHKAKRLAKINHASIKSIEHYASQVAALAALTPNSAPTTLLTVRGGLTSQTLKQLTDSTPTDALFACPY